ncbi:MAG: DUF2071 domain-containing protein [Phycisphaerales bacterium]
MPPTATQPRAGRPALFMRWLHLAFIHWPVPPETVRRLLPPGLELDTFDGQAWVGLVPFTMRDVRPFDAFGVPTATHFHECNVRTYARDADGTLGVWFFSLDAQSRLAVLGARLTFNLPYFYARMSLDRTGDTVRYSTTRSVNPRAALRCEWEAGSPLPASEPGSLAWFLTERYALFSVGRRGRICRGRITHPRWPLRDARLLSIDDGLVAAAGIDVRNSGAPIVWHADRLDVDAFALERVGDGR